MRYFGTFIPGAEDIVAGILAQRLKDLRLVDLQSGAVEFETALAYSGLNLFCVNNLFQVLYSAPARAEKAGLEKFARGLPTAPVDWKAAGEHPARCRSFRLMTSCQNQLTALSAGAKTALEKRLAEATGLRVDRGLPDSEFWVLTRREGKGYLLKRLSRHRAYDKLLHPGELHPELAYMLCWLSAPQPTDRVLDPFCGYGAIPVQRCKRFPYAKMLAFDQDPVPLALAQKKLGQRPGLVFAQGDALRLGESLPPESVDAIITDPPWGLYRDTAQPLGAFYTAMLGAFCQVLKPGGRVVVLTAGKRELAEALADCPQLGLKEEYHLLVSGKKCGVFVLLGNASVASLVAESGKAAPSLGGNG